jgi:predicted phage baseplate assembly protein
VRRDPVSTLFGQSDQSRSYEIAHFDDGRTVLLFGDGIEGARLPSGQTNVRARYRKGLGASGNLPTGQISTLLTRPLGIEGASNSEPATGGQDPETLDDARSNAPLTVLTLDRAVSVDDYRDFARSYAGIAKAHALWVPTGPARGMFLTVAGVDGAAVDPASATMKNLIASLRRYGDPMMPLRAASYTPASFVMRMTVKIDPRFESALVLASVRYTLRHLFSFAQRDFGQHAAQDEATAFAHRVDGVVAVRMLAFHKADAPGGLVNIVPASSPQISLLRPPDPAEILTLDQSRLHLEVMA